MKNDYEFLKDELALGLTNKGIDIATVGKVIDVLNAVSSSYHIEKVGTDLSVPDAKYEQILKYYAMAKCISGRQTKSMQNAMYVIRNLFAYVRKDIEAISTNDIRYFLYQYQQEKGISDRTKDHYRVMLHSFFTWCASEKYIGTNPAENVDAIKYEIKQRGYLNKMEVEIVREHLQTDREKAIIEFMLSTGCRVSEVTNCKIQDVDFANSRVTVFGKGKKFRTVYLNARATLALQKYLSGRNDRCEYLFVSERCENGEPHGIQAHCVQHLISTIDERIKSRVSVKITPHILRHTFATLSVKAGMSIETLSKILGHTSVNVTMVYTTVDDDDTRKAFEKFVS